MATKNNPGAFLCYQAALPDEPFFTILARDPAGPATLEFWARERVKQDKNHSTDDKARIAEAIDEASDMAVWRATMVAHAAETGEEPVWRVPRQIVDDGQPVRSIETYEKADGTSPSGYALHAKLEKRQPYQEPTEADYPDPEEDFPLLLKAFENAIRDDPHELRRINYKRNLNRVLNFVHELQVKPAPQVAVYHEGLFLVPGVKEPQTMAQISTVYQDQANPKLPSGLHNQEDLARITELEETVKYHEGLAAYRKAAQRTTVDGVKMPVVDSKPDDLAHGPEVPHHRFSVFHEAGQYAYARGLEVNPIHLPTALDAMAKSGWHLLSIFGQTDSKHIGFIFRKNAQPLLAGDPLGLRPARMAPELGMPYMGTTQDNGRDPYKDFADRVFVKPEMEMYQNGERLEDIAAAVLANQMEVVVTIRKSDPATRLELARQFERLLVGYPGTENFRLLIITGRGEIAPVVFRHKGNADTLEHRITTTRTLWPCAPDPLDDSIEPGCTDYGRGLQP